MKNIKHISPHLLLPVLLAAVALCAMVGAAPVESFWDSPIVWQLRMPRILLAVVVGAALSVCGATYQSVFRNPLTDPYLLGVSSGASLGAAVAIVLGLQRSGYGVALCALLSALATVWLIYRIASVKGKLRTTTLLLAGISLSLLISALVSVLMVMNNDKMDAIIFWTMGSFASASYADIAVLLPIVAVCVAVVLYHCKHLNLLMGGTEQAQSLGVDVGKVQKRLLGVTTLMVAFAVAACGVIGFVGLIVPHAVRIVVGSDNRRVIPFSIYAGAIFLLLCDTASRTLFAPSELPVGTVTAVIGAPLFIAMLLKK